MQSDSHDPSAAKPKCSDCTMCQACSEVRCRACRSRKGRARKKKLSLEEQIALFNSLNPHLVSPAGSPVCNYRKQDKS
jgi:hypothetical protein